MSRRRIGSIETVLTVESLESRVLFSSDGAQLTVPPDYFPTTAGLTWEYREVEDGTSLTVDSLYELHDGEYCFVLERHEGDWETERDYYRIDGDLIGNVYYLQSYSPYTPLTISLEIEPPPMSDVFSHPGDRTLSWPGTTYHGTVTDEAGVTAMNGNFDMSQASLAGQPLELSSGIRFTQTLMVDFVETGNAWWTRPDGTTDTEQRTTTTRRWYVRGLGMVREEYTNTIGYTDAGGQPAVSEHQEQYELTAIPPWARFTTLSDGVLQVDGTDIPDNIHFEARATDMVVYRNGLPETVPYAGLKAIVINGFDGDDRIDPSALSFPATITGGDGNDTILAGSGADLLYGGNGDDQVSGGAGSDTIYGNFGNDVIGGGLQRDSIMAGIGDDTVTAGDGPDTVYGGDGRDLLRGGKGADYIAGKGKADTIYGGAMNDTILGQAGDDLIMTEDGDDRVFVNDGSNLVFRDTVYAGAGLDAIDHDEMDLIIYPTDTQNLLS